MEINVIKDNQEEFEFILETDDPTLPELLVGKLLTYKEVKFAAYRWEHPLKAEQHVIVKGKNPKKLVKKAISELRKELKKIKQKLFK